MSTTLAIVISTTLICGGLTEPMLTKMGMRVDPDKNDDNDRDDRDADTEAGTAPSSGMNSSHGSTHSALCDHSTPQKQGEHSKQKCEMERGDKNDDTPSTRTATSSSILEMLNGVSSRNKYEVYIAHNPNVLVFFASLCLSFCISTLTSF